jgi:hypothetical protein
VHARDLRGDVIVVSSVCCARIKVPTGGERRPVTPEIGAFTIV